MKQFSIRIVNKNDSNDFEEVGTRHEGRINSFVDLMWTRINSDYKIVVFDEDGKETTDY